MSACGGGVQRRPLLGVACVDVSAVVYQQSQQLIEVINATLHVTSIVRHHQHYTPTTGVEARRSARRPRPAVATFAR